MEKITLHLRTTKSWILRDAHRVWYQRQRDTVNRAFTTHPHESGESYLEHLWFTIRMAGRFLYVAVVLLLHGIFPFIFMRAASSQIETVYRIMKKRIPKARRDELDIDYHV